MSHFPSFALSATSRIEVNAQCSEQQTWILFLESREQFLIYISRSLLAMNSYQIGLLAVTQGIVFLYLANRR